MHKIKVCYVRSHNEDIELNYLKTVEIHLYDTIKQDVEKFLEENKENKILNIYTINTFVIDCFRLLIKKNIIKNEYCVFSVLFGDNEFLDYCNQHGKMSNEYWEEQRGCNEHLNILEALSIR